MDYKQTIVQELIEATDLPEPQGWRILVEPIMVKTETAGGIALPESALRAMEHLRYIGRVRAMGPLCYKHKKFEGSVPWCNVGDWIAYGQYTGQETIIRAADKDGQKRNAKLRIINDDEVLAVIPNPEAVLIYI